MKSALRTLRSNQQLRARLPWAVLVLGALGVDGLACWGLLQGGAAPAALWLLVQALLVVGSWAWLWRQLQEGPVVRLQTGLALLLALGLSANAVWGGYMKTALSQIRPPAENPALRVELQDQGRTLRLQGPLQSGDAVRLLARLRAEPALVRLDLALAGGSFGDARQLAAAVAERGLQTRLVGRCERDCTLIFLAGRQRQVLPQGLLALQRLEAPSLNPIWVQGLRMAQRRIYLAAGLPDTLVTKLLLSPAPYLRDTAAPELQLKQVIGQRRFALDVELPPEPGASASEYQQALSSNSHWLALDRRFPGVMQLAAGRMLSARAQGAPEEAAHQAAHALALAGIQQMLAKLGPELRLQYLQMLDAQLAALTADSDCQALLAGDSAVRRRLPPELSLREAEWIENAALEPVPDAAARRFSALEGEVLRRSVGLTRMHELARLWGPDAGARPGCASARRSLAQLQGLPGPQRLLALRRVFD